MAPLLEHPILQLPYVQSILIIIGAIVLSAVFSLIMKIVHHKVAKKTKTNLDDLLIAAIQKPIWYIILLFGLRLALVPLGITHVVVNTAVLSLIIIIVTWLIVRTIDAVLDAWGKDFAKKSKSSLDDELLPLLHKASRILFWALGFLMVLKQWGVEIGPLLASLGIMGLALGFAIKDTLANIFGGISLLMDKAFRVGDIVKLDSGVMGLVHEIGLRSTRIKTFDNQIVIVPNGNLAVSNIENWLQPNKAIRITIDFGVEYGTQIDKVKKLAAKILKADKRVSKEHDPQILFTDMADSALTFRLRFFVDDISVKLATEDDVRTKLYNALNKAKIGIPFPCRTLYFPETVKTKTVKR